MKLPKIVSREGFAQKLGSIGKLRIKITHDSIMVFSALLLIMLVAFTIRILPLRWEIPSGAVHLSEFDPYYQYSLTKHMVENGILSPYWPVQWVDKQRWSPGGINMGMSLSSLPMTAAVFYEIVTALGVNVDLMAFCAFIPAILGSIAVLLIYFLGKDIAGKTVGLFAALSLALSSSFIQRTSLGFFDTETVGIVSLLLFSILFLRAIDTEKPIGSTVKYSLGSAFALAYFIMGWGAAYYLIGLVALFVFVLILLKRYTRRLLLTYSLTFGLGLLLSINNPYISADYLTSFAILPVAGIFALLCLSEVIRNLTSARGKFLFAATLLVVLVSSFAAIWILGYSTGIAGKFWSVLDPFTRESSPLLESVAEHRISAWSSIYFDLGIGVLFSIVGLYFVSRNLTNKNLFMLLFGLTSIYFACSMVRLIALMAPAFSLLIGIGTIGLLKPFYTLLREQPKMIARGKFGLERVGTEFSGIAVFLIFLILMTNFAFTPQSGGIPKVIKQSLVPVTITVGSLPIAPTEPVSEWLDMLQYLNNFQDSNIVVCSWWDYGYWLSIVGNVTSLADNATINGTQIQNVGFTFMANESQSVKMLSTYKAKYILVFTTIDSNVNWIGYGDEGKWMWMARISGQASERFLGSGLTDSKTSWTDEKDFGKYDNTTNKWVWNDHGTNTTIYALMSNAKHSWALRWKQGQDPDAAVAPRYFKEAYIAGLSLSPNDAGKYGGVIPLVCLYEIDWQKYYTDYPSQ